MKTGPYIIASFAPAQRTVPGGVAILVRDNLYFEKDKYIPQKGLNWAAVKIRLRKKPGQNKRGNSPNIVTSYTQHGNEYDTLTTIDQFQNYLDQYTCPSV